MSNKQINRGRKYRRRRTRKVMRGLTAFLANREHWVQAARAAEKAGRAMTDVADAGRRLAERSDYV